MHLHAENQRVAMALKIAEADGPKATRHSNRKSWAVTDTNDGSAKERERSQDLDPTAPEPTARSPADSRPHAGSIATESQADT